MIIMVRNILFAVCIAAVHGSVGQSILPEDYLFDGNGNMVRDVNKNIADIHYNARNLPDTITYTDGRKIIYVYTATGQRIRQQVLNAAGTVTIKRDYAGGFLYEGDTLMQLQHEEGRVVWNAGAAEYQYHLKDHLANVRTTVTSAPETLEYLATMESEKSDREDRYFSGMGTRSLYAVANHTADGNEVLNVGPGVARAASLGLAVHKGDVVYLEVYAYYENGVTDKDMPGSPSLQNTVASVVSSTGAIGGKILSAEAGALSAVSSPMLMLLALPDAGTEQVPSAYLNYTLFDQNYVLATAGYRKVTKQGAYAKELLMLGPLEIKEQGYLDVYLSNTGSNTRVYFDDLKVTHVEGPIVQEDSYDPFGMSLSAQHAVRYGEQENRYLYNGKELQADHDLNWYDYGARMYDAALGRWHVHDPLAEKYASWSPYQYALNNPVKFIDPDGRDVHNHQVEETRMNKIKQALELLRSLDEGGRIMSDVENNPDVAVYIAGVGEVVTDNKYRAGETHHIYDLGKRMSKQSGVLDPIGPAAGNLGVFKGMDITDDIRENRDLYLIPINVDDFDIPGIASAIAHEIEAHVNTNQSLKSIIGRDEKVPVYADGTPTRVPHGEFEHYTFGSYFIDEGGHIENPRQGTSAERVRNEIEAVRKVAGYVNTVRNAVEGFWPWWLR